ncbi:MAG: ABC transporter ATP-binding protein [Euzebya sp.]
MSLISVAGLRRTFGDAVALDSLDLEIEGGECVALLGHNGSGKTTALTAIAGLVPPTSGRIRVAGADPFEEPGATAARRALAYVPDAPVFYDDMTVAEHIELTGVGHGLATTLGTDAFDKRCKKLIVQFGLDEHRDHVPEQLSAGLQQRTQLACAFVRPFKALLLDEPVLRLDPAAQQLLSRRLDGARRRGAAVLLSTHSPSFARNLADRIVVLEHGSVVADGTFEQIQSTDAAVHLGLN